MGILPKTNNQHGSQKIKSAFIELEGMLSS